MVADSRTSCEPHHSIEANLKGEKVSGDDAQGADSMCTHNALQVISRQADNLTCNAKRAIMAWRETWIITRVSGLF